MPNWSDQAIDIVQRFGALIVPLYDKSQPGTKLNPTKPSNKDLPPHKLPSSDPDIIRKWAEYHPGYGVVPHDKFLIIDIDVKEGQNGKASLKFLKEHGLPIDTFAVLSPSGGVHLYYQHPAHYKPAQSTGSTIGIRFADPVINREWELLQISSAKESTGVDTRYGWGYVAGPGSDFDGYTYNLLQNSELKSIPIGMEIGYKGKVKQSTTKPIEEIPPHSIKQDRNNHATMRTFELAKRGLPLDIARATIRGWVDDYDNHDGEAPTYEDMWDMYIRALEKVDDGAKSLGNDILDQLINTKIYIVKGENVMDAKNPDNTVTFSEFKASLENQLIAVESGGDLKYKNPAEVWKRSPDRVTIMDKIFSIEKPFGLVQLNEHDDHPHFNEFVPPVIYNLVDAEYTDLGEKMFNAAVKVFKNVFTAQEDFEWWTKWVGSMFFMPSFRPAWHWHIFSRGRGIGKDLSVTIISHMYGISNVKYAGIELFQDKSNIEFFNSGLMIFSDFKRITDKRGDILAKFKALTGTGKSRKRDLYKSGMQGEVHCRFIFLSNHEDDFPVDENDRRIYKCRSTSKNNSIAPSTAALAESIAFSSGRSEAILEKAGLVVTEKDRIYARARLFEMFKNSNYEEMVTTIDCPLNKTKTESLITSAPVYVEEIQRLINLKAFVFATDIITEESIYIWREKYRVKTSLGSILTTLLELDIIRPVKVLRSKDLYPLDSNAVPAYIKARGMEYIPEIDTISHTGENRRYKCYAVRRFEWWCNLSMSRQVSREYKKVFNYAGISKGIDVNMLKDDLLKGEEDDTD